MSPKNDTVWTMNYCSYLLYRLIPHLLLLFCRNDLREYDKVKQWTQWCPIVLQSGKGVPFTTFLRRFKTLLTLYFIGIALKKFTGAFILPTNKVSFQTSGGNVFLTLLSVIGLTGLVVASSLGMIRFMCRWPIVQHAAFPLQNVNGIMADTVIYSNQVKAAFYSLPTIPFAKDIACSSSRRAETHGKQSNHHRGVVIKAWIRHKNQLFEAALLSYVAHSEVAMFDIEDIKFPTP